jgi:hypothetical protein
MTFGTPTDRFYEGPGAVSFPEKKRLPSPYTNKPGQPFRFLTRRVSMYPKNKILRTTTVKKSIAKPPKTLRYVSKDRR